MRRLVLAVVLAAPALPGAEPLGPLFYTPAQRVQLDAARSARSRTPVAPEAPSAPAPVPERLTYDGMVRRSDGKTTVWINNRAINDGRPAEGFPFTSRLRPDGSVRLGVTQAERSVDLKVGQSAEIVSGTIAEPYSRPAARSAPATRQLAAPDAAAQASRVPATAHKDPDDSPSAR